MVKKTMKWKMPCDKNYPHIHTHRSSAPHFDKSDVSQSFFWIFCGRPSRLLCVMILFSLFFSFLFSKIITIIISQIQFLWTCIWFAVFKVFCNLWISRHKTRIQIHKGPACMDLNNLPNEISSLNRLYTEHRS